MQRAGAVERGRLVQVPRHVEDRRQEDDHRVADAPEAEQDERRLRPARVDWNQSGPWMPSVLSAMLTGPSGIEEVDEAESRRDRRRERRKVEDRAEEADARSPRVSISATPKANSTCSGTAIAMIQRCFDRRPDQRVVVNR